MAKQTIVALSTDGIWLCGKIGRRPFALKYSDEDFEPVVYLENDIYFAKAAFQKNIHGRALIKHTLGCNSLSPKEKHILNALLSFSAQLPVPPRMSVMSTHPLLYIAEVDDGVVQRPPYYRKQEV